MVTGSDNCSVNCDAGKKGHKGRGKQFSNPEEIDRQMRAQEEVKEFCNNYQFPLNQL